MYAHFEPNNDKSICKKAFCLCTSLKLQLDYFLPYCLGIDLEYIFATVNGI